MQQLASIRLLLEQIKIVAELNSDTGINPNSKPVVFQVLRGSSDGVGLPEILNTIGIQQVIEWEVVNYAFGQESSIIFWNGEKKPPPGLIVIPICDIPTF